MAFVPKPQEIYKHFKGNLYQIVAIAEHSETGELLVIYQALYGDFKTYARPLEMFVSRVDKNKYPDAEQEFRFELQGADKERQRRETPDARPQEPKEAEESRKPAESKKPEEFRKPAAPKEPEEAALDPMLMDFLDADTYEARLNILAGLHHRITNEMITTMAISCDVEVEEGDLEERYESLKSCLLTREKYECNRLR